MNQSDVRAVVLITLDCARYDSLFPGGTPIPEIRSLAQDGTVFHRCFSHSQNTLSSHVSLLTSTYLHQHGVYDNYQIPPMPPWALHRIFQDQGWDTAAFVSAEFLANTLGDHMGRPDPDWKKTGFMGKRNYRKMGHRRWASRTLERAKKWLLARKKKSFSMIHLFDSHMAYRANPHFQRDIPHRSHSATVLEKVAQKGWFSPPHEEFKAPNSLGYSPAFYQGAVREEAYLITKFVQSLGPGVLVAITADHGECLMGDHGVYCAHKYLYHSTTHTQHKPSAARDSHTPEQHR